MTADVDSLRARLAQIGKRAEKATPGPWSAADEHGLIPGATSAWCVSRMDAADSEKYLYDITYMASEGNSAPIDAEFTAAARTDVPALLAAVNAVLDLHRPVTVTTTWGMTTDSRDGTTSIITSTSEQCGRCHGHTATASGIWPCEWSREVRSVVAAALGTTS